MGRGLSQSQALVRSLEDGLSEKTEAYNQLQREAGELDAELKLVAEVRGQAAGALRRPHPAPGFVPHAFPQFSVARVGLGGP